MNEYDAFKKLILSHPDKSRILKTLTLADDLTDGVITCKLLVRKGRIPLKSLEKILYLLSSIKMLRIETVGRASIYTVTADFGGRLLDELKGSVE